jgi:hypothetical protein
MNTCNSSNHNRHHYRNHHHHYDRAAMLVFMASSILGGSLTLAYDIGCMYPEEMPKPFSVQQQSSALFTQYPIKNKLETPIIVHQAHLYSHCETDCIAYHDDKSLSSITKERPPFSTPPKYFNSWSRTLCMVQCQAMNYAASGLPDQEHVTDALYAYWNFELLPRSQELVNCAHEPSCLQAVVEDADYDPRIIGQVVHLDIFKSQQEDGWNSLGRQTYDAESDSIVECTTNCAAYSDTSGYFPRNHPGKKRSKKRSRSLQHQYSAAKDTDEKKGKKKSNSSKQKYDVKGKNKLWQPLLETNDYGNFLRQDHVVPHIGYTVKPKVLSEFKKADKPIYDYASEAELVVKRLRELVGDDKRIEILRFFDSKLYPRALIQLSFIAQFAPVGLSFEDFCMFLAGLDAAEHDSVLQVWREKVRFDRVRPTTVIQRWGDDEINTYNGIPSSTDPEYIKARDFQSFIRVMPHSEYPSGSASICTAYAEFVDLFTQEFFGTDLSLLPVGPDGANYGCDDPTSAFKLGCGTPFHIHNMTELADICGQSRLWGGMHFTKSVEAGHDVATGIGKLALQFAKDVKAGSNWTSSSYIGGADRPVCGSGTPE